MEAAEKLFDERGYEGVSIREITAAAGTNLAAINYHFHGKEELFTTVVGNMIAPLRARVRKIADGSGSARSKLEDIFRQYGLYVLHEQPGLRALFAEAIHGGRHLPAHVAEALAWRDRVVGRIIRQGIGCGEFRECNVGHVTWLFFGMLAPFVIYHRLADPDAAHRPYARSEVETIVHAALDVFMNGLRQADGREAPICHKKGSV